MQFSPVYPVSQTQSPLIHLPCFPQFFKQIGIEQSFPDHPSKHIHPFRVHFPCPEQKLSQMIILQFLPE